MEAYIKSESKIQKQIIDYLKKNNYYVIKLITTSINGIPDILAIKNDVLFIEVKSEKGKLSPLQEYRIKELKDRDINCIVAKSVFDVKSFIKAK